MDAGVLSLSSLLAFVRPDLDWHALAPELTLLAVGTLVTVADIALDDRAKRMMPTLAGVGLLVTLVPILTLAADGAERPMFGGAYVVDDFSLVLKALFILAGYVVVLMSVDYVRDGDYYENEYYTLLLTSLLGMVMMASSRDLISVFVALELLSIPAYMLAAWRKGGPRSNEAGLKYYLMGVFASAVMLYGMSLLFGVAGDTDFGTIAAALRGEGASPIVIVAILFVLIGFAFKVSAVPFHTWAPDTYEGAPTPVTAFLSVASKAAGLVALLGLTFAAFEGAADVVQPFFWVLAAVTMTVGNLVALRQTNIVRMLAYSGVAQGGFMLAPLAVAFEGDAWRIGGTEVATTMLPAAYQAVVVYAIIYAFMNLGAFSVVLAVSRRTRSGEIASYGGLFSYAPGMAVLMTLFVAALAGIPPASGWYAKFVIFRALAEANTAAGWVLAVVVAVNAVLAFGYYARVLRQMWFHPVPDAVALGIDTREDGVDGGDTAHALPSGASGSASGGVPHDDGGFAATQTRPLTMVAYTPGPIPITGALAAALVITAAATFVFGVLPGLVSHFGQIAFVYLGG
ncbi:NADH-quinone oxidoreductase subunit N [Candidatus Poriferisodalis sp.]|uniref:NADH-quinone oxidoreductase subunit N n=1 Tax=Candidatus Poriferisodalis sp. TaxID=3101277 RepID=UPI003B02D1EE